MEVQKNPTQIEWKVSGMTCTNCALTIQKYLEGEGYYNVQVDFIGGEVRFETKDNSSIPTAAKGIESLGYHVVLPKTGKSKRFALNTHGKRFLFCAPFTAVLLLHMFPLGNFHYIHYILMNPWLQMLICLPVFITGSLYFGKSAIKSLQKGVPNMNVLIALGSTAAFVYSFIGTLFTLGADYFFYETTATIITLVFLGEWVEERTIQATQKELRKLSSSQVVMANMIAFDEEHKEIILQIENSQLHVGDLILIKSGEQVPMDCKILWGNVRVNEALLTGESKPVIKKEKEKLIGGSIITDGTVKAQVTAIGNDTVLSSILNLVKKAQSEKPPLQQLADKISAIFVPVVVGLAAITFIVNYFFADVNSKDALMRSIAVLVISCPCAMGLATPAAIAVGLGRAAKNGILFRNAKSLELFKNIQAVVFDKTGTLTKGDLKIVSYKCWVIEETVFKKLVVSLEKFSNHPVAKCIMKKWKINQPVYWKKVEEVKGIGIEAEDKDGNVYKIGSYKWAHTLTDESEHTAYVLMNEKLIGWIDVEDEIRSEAKTVIDYLHTKNIQTILLSGDSKQRCNVVAKPLGIDEVIAEQTPDQKLQFISSLTEKMPVAMVGDGINDAPALAKATIGISISEATQIALQSSQVVLMNDGLKNLPLALGLGKHTFFTIRQNLFWAFIYNIIAIPIAGIGLLSPGIAALAMGFSDVVLAINSIWLNYKRVV